MKPNPMSVPSSVRKRFIDFFSRGNTSEGLGVSVFGGLWDSIRGSFRIQDQRAISEDDPSLYPMSTINMSQSDVDLLALDVDNGSAAALWVTDSGEWFAVGVEQTGVECNCEVGTECNRWNASNVTGYYTFESGGRNAYNVASGQYCVTNQTGGGNANYRIFGYRTVTGCSRYIAGGSCVSWYRYSVPVYGISGYNSPTFSTQCNTNFSTAYNSPNYTTNIDGYNAKTCNRWNEYTFNCETCYPQWIRVLQSAAGTVTTLARFLASSASFRTIKSPNETLDLIVQDSPLTSFIKSFLVGVRGEELSITAFSDEGALEVLDLDAQGEITYTPTGAQVTPTYGIMVTPSEYNQENFIGGIQITRDDFTE